MPDQVLNFFHLYIFSKKCGIFPENREKSFLLGIYLFLRGWGLYKDKNYCNLFIPNFVLKTSSLSYEKKKGFLREMEKNHFWVGDVACPKNRSFHPLCSRFTLVAATSVPQVKVLIQLSVGTRMVPQTYIKKLDV